MRLIGTLTHIENEFSVISKSKPWSFLEIDFIQASTTALLHVHHCKMCSQLAMSKPQLSATFVLIELSIGEEVQCGHKNNNFDLAAFT
jgi:hypothetical protein